MLQSVGSQRIRHNCVTERNSVSVCVCVCIYIYIYIYIYIWPMAEKAWDPKHWADRIFPYFVYSFLDLIFIIKFPSYHIVFEIKF